jgi:hypothetical protein
MKPIILIPLAIIVAACATQPLTQPQLDPSFFNTPNTTTVTVNDNHRQISPLLVDDEDVYQGSLSKIEDTIHQQALMLAICREVGKPSDCVKQQKRFCEVPELIDSRGGRWFKPFCKR